MKSRLILTLLAAALCLAGCRPEPVDVERDIVYTVDKDVQHVTTHTDAEWQSLLDRFCDYAQAGSSVSFHRYRPSAKGTSAADDEVTFSTTSRDEMKKWMSDMEDKGMTVTVTYDKQTGTYHGTAYATAPQPQLPSGGLLTYVIEDVMPLVSHIMSFDTVNHLIYSTVHDHNIYVTDPRHLEGVYEYTPCIEVNTPDAYWLVNSRGDTAGLFYISFADQDTLHFSPIPGGGVVAKLPREDDVQTYLCSDMGLDLVMHVFPCIADISFPPEFTGQTSSPFHVDCVTPFQPGRFNMLLSVQETDPVQYGLTLDYEAYGGDVVSSGLTLQGMSTDAEDSTFTIIDPDGGCTNYYHFRRM